MPQLTTTTPLTPNTMLWNVHSIYRPHPASNQYMCYVIQGENTYEHQVHGSNDSHGISQKMSSRDLVEAGQMSETRGANLASVRSFAAVTDKVHTHLALWCLDSAVGLTRRYSITLAVEQKVVNECLHVLLHGSTWRWSNLVIFDLDGTSGHLVQTLVDDAQRLTEFLHTAKITVVAVTVDTNRYVKLNLVVGIIRLRLPNVPRHS